MKKFNSFWEEFSESSNLNNYYVQMESLLICISFFSFYKVNPTINLYICTDMPPLFDTYLKSLLESKLKNKYTLNFVFSPDRADMIIATTGHKLKNIDKTNYVLIDKRITDSDFTRISNQIDIILENNF